MLKSGNEHLASLRDGRAVYIGAERVDDVTTHPAFRNAARSMAAIYDLKRADPAFSFTDGGEQSFAPTYACRPPGVHHGPFTSKGGCILHEIHYYETSGKGAGHAKDRQ